MLDNDTPTDAIQPGSAQGGTAQAETGAGVHEWMNALPDDLKTDPTLSRYRTVEDIARGHLEARRVASSKVPTPGDTPESFTAFVEAVRPADAKVYDIPIGEGQADSAYADRFREKAFDLGLLPQQAKGLAEMHNAFLKDEESRLTQEQLDQVESFKGEYTKSGRDFDRQLANVKQNMAVLGIDESKVNQLQMSFGAADTLKILFGLVDKVGEQPRHDGKEGRPMSGTMTPSDAVADLKTRMGNPEWRKKAMTDGTPERAEYDRLVRLRAQADLPPQ